METVPRCEHPGCTAAASLSVGVGPSIRGAAPEAHALTCLDHLDRQLKQVAAAVLHAGGHRHRRVNLGLRRLPWLRHHERRTHPHLLDRIYNLPGPLVEPNELERVLAEAGFAAPRDR